MTHEAPPQLRDVVITVVAILVACAIGLGILEWQRPQPSDQLVHNTWTDGSMTGEADLVAAKNRLVDRLESFDLDGALEQCQIVIEAAPGDKLGWRNQTIARLLALDREANPISAIDPAADPQAYEDALEAAHAAVGQLLKADPASGASHYLAARLAYLRHDWKAVATSLGQAEKKDPENPRYPYAWFDMSRHTDDPAIVDQRTPKLMRAARLAPENLTVALECVLAQTGDDVPELHRAIVRLRKLAEPYAESIRASADVEVLSLLDRAQECCTAPSPDGKGALSHSRRAASALKCVSATRLGNRTLRPHPLEFVVHNFADDPREAPGATGITMPDTVAVSFVRLPNERQIPLGDEVRAVRFADVDLDGLLDAVVLRKLRLEVYSPVAAAPGWKLSLAYKLSTPATGLLLADLDHDAAIGLPQAVSDDPSTSSPVGCAATFADAIVYGDSGIVVLRNFPDGEPGKRRWEPVRQMDEFSALKNVIAVAVADLDQDGNLDLLVSSAHGLSVWAGTAEASFTSPPLRSVLPQAAPTALLAADVNRDARVDFVIAGSDLLGPGLLENLGAGQLRWRPFPAAYSGLEGATALALIDADANASWDFLASASRGLTLAQTSTVEGTIVFRAGKLLSPDQFSNIRLCDYDNDGYRDVLAGGSGGSGLAVFRGGSHGNFVAIDGLFGAATGTVTALDVDDFDADGDLDVVAAIDAQAVVFANDGGNANHSLRVAARAESSQPNSENGGGARHNTARGSLLEIKAGPLYQAQVVDRPWTHVGLGKRQTADIVRIVWPGGAAEQQVHCGGSVVLCRRDQPPFVGSHLYSWNGALHEFIGRMLTKRTLTGSRRGAQPAHEVDAVRIPGKCLLPTGGEYRLHIVDDFCGASYIDSLRLIAVDHPPDTEIFMNEQAADGKADSLVHAISNPRFPVGVSNGRRENVRPSLLEEDGRYVGSFRQRLKPGLVERHMLEIELGELDEARSITLYLTGRRVAAAAPNKQKETADVPSAAISVSVPDAQGSWQALPRSVEFPSGRTATAAIELTDAFAAGDYRVRIETNLEIYWDQVFFTVGEEPVPVTLTELPPLAADLHYRGFSRRHDGPPGTPATYSYDAPTSTPKWFPIQGRFTRYGDVGELLIRPDDRLVVTGGGDELTVRFAVPEEPAPAGWRRDFILHCAGWSKPADVNASAGDCCEPLPFSGMTGYPVSTDAAPPESQEYGQYLQTYQTRRQNWHAFWKHIRFQSSPSRRTPRPAHPFALQAP